MLVAQVLYDEPHARFIHVVAKPVLIEWFFLDSVGIDLIEFPFELRCRENPYVVVEANEQSNEEKR